MKERCWQCGRKLQLPHFAQVEDYDGNVLRVHKACLADAQMLLRPPNFSDVNPESGRRMPTQSPDKL
jgi:hypothetical protein